MLASVDIETGEERWSQRLSCGGAWASPIATAEHVWFFGTGGLTSVLRVGPDGVEELRVNKLVAEGRVHGVAAVDGKFLVREDSRVLCID